MADTTQAAIKRATAAAQRKMVALDSASLDELEQLYRQSAKNIAQRIAEYSGADGNVSLQEMQSVLAQVYARLKELTAARNALLNETIATAAELGTQPLIVSALSPAPLPLAGEGVLTAAAAMTINHEALQFVRTFVAADGLQLSDRIWRLDRHARDVVVNAIEQAIIQGQGATQAARELLMNGQPVPADIADKINAANAQQIGKAAGELLTGDGSPMVNAMRLMRTEINRAHGMAYAKGFLAHPFAAGVRFLLSPGHPKPDICDLLSTQNLHGLGQGVYPTVETSGWPAHPNTLSFLIGVFQDEVTEEDRAGKETPLQALDRLTPAQRIGVLGVNKHQVFKDGKLTQGMIKAPWSAVKSRIQDRIPVMPEDLRDELSKSLFSGREITVSGMHVAVKFGDMGIDAEVIKTLSGAPDGSRIFVKKRNTGLGIEVRNELFTHPLIWQLGADGVLHGIEFYLAPSAPVGLGTRMMATSIMTAREVGLKEVQLMAAGRPDNGYYTWPRLGFDALLTEADLRIAERSGIVNVSTVLDIMQTPEWRAWWMVHGTGREMAFSLDADSQSMRVLQLYLNEKGIRL